MNSIKVCEYSRSRSFHDDLILQDQASGERSQDHWSSGLFFLSSICVKHPYFITKTCPCIVYPVESHFYIAKLGYAGA